MLTADHSQLLRDPLAGFMTDLPPLSSSASGDLRDVVINALRRRDHTLLKELLDEADILRPEVALRAMWLPLALGIDAWDAAGEPLIDGRPLGRTVRAQARAALVSLPELAVSRWLIPSRNISPVEIRGNPCFRASRSACVPLPAPGGPISTTHLSAESARSIVAN